MPYSSVSPCSWSWWCSCEWCSWSCSSWSCSLCSCSCSCLCSSCSSCSLKCLLCSRASSASITSASKPENQPALVSTFSISNKLVSKMSLISTLLKSVSMIFAFGWIFLIIFLTFSSSTLLTSLTLFKTKTSQNSICCITKFSMSSSLISCFVSSSPQPNSCTIRKTSTTLTIASSLQKMGMCFWRKLSVKNVKVCAIGIGSQMPLASIIMWSNLRCLIISCICSIKSWRKVQHIQPFCKATKFSSFLPTMPPFSIKSASIFTSPMSLTITATL